MGTETALNEALPAGRAGVSSLPNWSETARTAGTVTASMLTIVIPALNEQESIGLTIQRCLDARERIRRIGHVADVEIIVVSDGSTDRTAHLAQEFAAREKAVRVIVFEKNRGYGAAIKEGFAQGSGDLVAFLDADGTCDPNYFGELCAALQAQHTILAIGSRMGKGSEMPRIRRIGNLFYALLLGFLSGQAVSDTASGMRVIRRDALASLYPLPDGLHFTPAMSARALMLRERVAEVPMPYAERIGDSKLRVLRDGVRFMLSIRDAALLYQPSRLFGFVATFCVAIGALLGAYPVEFYWGNRRLEEWMIYRLLLCGLLFISAFSLIAASVLSERILSLVYHRPQQSFLSSVLSKLLERSRVAVAAAFAVIAAVVLVWPGFVELARTGHVTMHWSRPIAAVFLLEFALFAFIYVILQKIVELWQSQLSHDVINRRKPERL